MINTNLTARQYVYDLLEFIANQIAICSHIQELLHNSQNDYTDADEDKRGEITKEIVELQSMLKNAIDLRRTAMLHLETDFECNKNYWCLVKHGLANRQFAIEVWYANFSDVKYEIMVKESTDQMLGIIAKFLGQELIVCGRCLNDKIKEIIEERKDVEDK